MKTKWYRAALMLLLLLSGFGVFAQVEERGGEDSTIKIEFRLTDHASNKSQTYKLYGINYSVNNPYYMQDESKLINNGSCGISIDMAQEADEFLLKWVAGAIKNASGEITIVHIGSVKKPRKIVFTDGKTGSSSESFYTATTTNSFPQISIYVKSLTVDGITIFTMAKPADKSE
ncbi:hypothetical protein CA265_01200 [Sphingobacteriaceae bacterium GW460-11-11-14-LB5]|nr:hypothetical protein CA265_01200 [Sphingobacteriaceae bacterium GW460-11-11-14-LB5]